jgi:hypothetical protein
LVPLVSACVVAGAPGGLTDPAVMIPDLPVARMAGLGGAMHGGVSDLHCPAVSVHSKELFASPFLHLL